MPPSRLKAWCTRSHLLTMIAIGFRSLTASPAIALSCWVTPSRASRTRKTTSDLCMASSERRRAKYSTDDASFVAALMPAVTISRNPWRLPSRPLKSKGSSTASRVVPARSFTMSRLLLRSRFARDALEVRLLVANISLVHDEDHRLAPAPQPRGNAVVQGRHAVEPVDDEKDERCGVDGEADQIGRAHV